MNEEEDLGYCPICNTPLEKETASDLAYCPECNPLLDPSEDDNQITQTISHPHTWGLTSDD
jgi:Zn-finger nucleic acid-binding protein